MCRDIGLVAAFDHWVEGSSPSQITSVKDRKDGRDSSPFFL